MRIPPDDYTPPVDNGPLFRLSDGDTSREAAAFAERHAETDRDRVRACLRQHLGGLTDFELAEKLGGQQTSLGKRRKEIGAIDTGIRRPSPSGCKAIVWALVAKEQAA